MFLFGMGWLFGWSMFMMKVTITMLLALLGYLYYNPTLITNFILTMIKNKETGAFDVRLGGFSWTFNSLLFNDLCWMNPVICGFTTPYFARIGSFSVAVDIFQCLQALCDPTNHVIVVRSLEIIDIEIYIEKVAEENPGPSLNLWAALGSKDDHEATNVHSMMQQSIAKVGGGGGGGGGGKGGMFDIGGLMKTATNAATPDRVEGVLHSALDMLTSEGDDHKATKVTNASTEQPGQPPAAAAVEKKGLPYKVQLSHFAIKELTLHVPAYLGAAAPPIKLSGVSLSDLSNAAGASVEDLSMKIIGQITQQILAKNPMMAMVGMIGGGMGGLGGVGDVLQGGLGGLGGVGDVLQGGLGGLVPGGGLGQVDGLMSSVMGGEGAGGALGHALEGLPGGMPEGLSGVLGGGGGVGDMLGGLGGFMPKKQAVGSTKPDGLPTGWTGHVDPASGNTFYVNSATNETTWQKPQHTQVAPDGLPAGWTGHVDPTSGKTYYVNSATNESTWEKPQHSQATPSIPGLPGNLGALGNAFGGGGGLGGFRF